MKLHPVHGPRARAEEALRRSSALVGAETTTFPRDSQGAPAPIRTHMGQWFWSLANTGNVAAAIVAPAPVGIDVEHLDRPRVAPLEAFADDKERRLLGTDDPERRLALWTGKEAVLKKAGCGLAELSACRLVEPPEEEALTFAHRGRRHRVLSFVRDRFLFAVACDADGFSLAPEEVAP
ncbi:MAG: 4'-phosphopantetheinyl transferase superfamily protein [Planctomycetota bacterium]|nr:4'-phosphopantetheinyl transferase superfamily protein [Planctomycetota bacterium]